MGVREATLHGELGLGFDGGVAAVRRAGVDAGVLLRQVGDLQAASAQQLHAALAGTGGGEVEGEKGEKVSQVVRASVTF